MKLTEIAESVRDAVVSGEAEIEKIYSSSKKKGERWLFVCNEKRGKKAAAYIDEAVLNGAAAVVCSEKYDIPVPQIVTSDVRSAYSYLCAALCGNPQKRVKTIGIVGTNGKTTTARLIGHILEKNGIKCGVIGTLGAFFGGEKRALDLTTPDPEDFFSIVSEMEKAGVKVVVTELSAHAIYYKKLDSVFFDALVYTNCTQDHLDFFKDMESYSAVKLGAFTDERCRVKIINADDPYSKYLAQKDMKNVVFYGLKDPADVFALKIRTSADGSAFYVNSFDSVEKVRIKLLGTFNVYNALAAIAAAATQGVTLAESAAALSECEAVSGRLEKICEHNGGSIYLDYAHTPDGLENALLALGKITEGALVCLFGCGGNRDKTKRAAMGRVAGDIADFVVITSDNPRFEDADAIINDVERGVREATLDYIRIKDREQAIRFAVRSITAGDVLLIAGKGAEEYQEVMGVKKEFSDKAVVLDAVSRAERA